MTVILAIVLSIAGLILLLIGDLPMSNTRRIKGARARAVGVVLLLTWPALFLVGFVVAGVWGVSVSAGRGEPLTSAELTTLIRPYVEIFRAITILIVLLIALAVAYWQRQSLPSSRRFDEDERTIPWFLGIMVALIVVMVLILGLNFLQVKGPCRAGDFDCARNSIALTDIALKPTQHAQASASATTYKMFLPTWTAQYFASATEYAVLAPTWAVENTQAAARQTMLAPTQRAIAVNATSTSVSQDATAFAVMTADFGSMTATVLYGPTKAAQRYAQATNAVLAPKKSLPGKLIFSDRFTDQMGVLDPTGDNFHLLTVSKWQIGDVVWSPDGQQLALAVRSPDIGIYVSNPDGSNRREITNTKDRVTDPAWSPDGKSIAGVIRQATVFDFANKIGPSALNIFNVNGGNPKQLYSSPGWIESPSWSADGKSIVFCLVTRPLSNIQNSNLYMVNADGSNAHPLTTNNTSCAPAWSPDGQHIAYMDIANYWHPDLYLMNADGTGVRQLTECLGGEPQWSPDSKHIVFTGGFSVNCYDLGPGDQGVFIYDLDTQAVTKLNPPGIEALFDETNFHLTSPSWGP